MRGGQECGTQVDEAALALGSASSSSCVRPVTEAIAILMPLLADCTKVADEDRQAIQELILAACDAGARLFSDMAKEVSDEQTREEPSHVGLDDNSTDRHLNVPIELVAGVEAPQRLCPDTNSCSRLASSSSILPVHETLSRATSGILSCASLALLPMAGRLSRTAAAKSEEVVELEERFNAAKGSEEQLEAATLLVAAREELVALLVKEGSLEGPCPGDCV